MQIFAVGLSSNQNILRLKSKGFCVFFFFFFPKKEPSSFYF